MHGLLENRVQAQPLRRLRPRPDLRRGPPALPDQGRPRHQGRPLVLPLVGYEVVPATGRPLLSVPICSTTANRSPTSACITHPAPHRQDQHLQRRHQRLGPLVQHPLQVGLHRRLLVTSKDGKTNFTTIIIAGPNQYPSFNGPGTQIILPGNTDVLNPGFLAGRRNPGYGGNDRYSSHQRPVPQVERQADPGDRERRRRTRATSRASAPAGPPQNASWYSFGNWFLYQFNDKVTGVWRSEIFRDNSGVRDRVRGQLLRADPRLHLQAQALPLDPARSPLRLGSVHAAVQRRHARSQLTLAFDVILLF